jgi:hypothetical protein
MKRVNLLLLALALSVVAIGGFAIFDGRVSTGGQDQVVCMLPGDFMTPRQQQAWSALENCPGSTSDSGPKINPGPDNPEYDPLG